MPPGFYRVEITKDGLNIPAKYNTETILGTEISYETMLQPIEFDLKFRLDGILRSNAPNRGSA